MEVNTSLNQNIDTLFQNIETFTQNEGTLGKSVNLGDKTLVPIISVTIGYGGGNTSGKMLQGSTSTTSTSSQGTSGSGVDALGLGAKITTDAIAVLDSSNNVQVLPVNTTASGMTQLMNKLPQMMGMGGQQQGQQNQGSQQGQSSQQDQQSTGSTQPYSQY